MHTLLPYSQELSHGRWQGTFWRLGPIISTSIYWLTERQVSSGAKQNRWNIDRKRAVKRWDFRLYNACRLLKQHRPFHDSYSSEPSLTWENKAPKRKSKSSLECLMLLASLKPFLSKMWQMTAILVNKCPQLFYSLTLSGRNFRWVDYHIHKCACSGYSISWHCFEGYLCVRLFIGFCS